MQVIKSLVEYYDNAVNTGIDLPREGWAMQSLDFVIVIDEDGNYLYVQDVRQKAPKGNKLVSAKVQMPAVARTRNIAANLCYDNSSYVLAEGFNDDKDPQDAVNKNEAFRALIAEHKDVVSIAPIHKFYSNDEGYFKLMNDTDFWDTTSSMKTDAYFTFAIQYNDNTVSKYVPLLPDVADM